MTDIDQFIAGLPKAELHLHIEGTLEPELMFALARRNDVTLPYGSIDEIRQAYDFGNLQDFLDIYYAGTNVLRTPQDFHDLAAAYFDRAAQDNIVHAEIMFDPQAHTSRGVPFVHVIEGLLSAMRDAEERHGITSDLILSFLRHLSEEEAFETLRAATPGCRRSRRWDWTPPKLAIRPRNSPASSRRGDAGLKLCAHAGEEGPPAYVWEALDLLKVDRIDHGNRALEEDALVKRLVDEQMVLTVCPLSNLKLCVIDDIASHPLDRMLDMGLRATVNSDDPAYFGGYLNDNYRAVAAARNLTREQIALLARNSITGSFLPQEAKDAHLATIDAYIAQAH
ncbi:adenosine deaminase [Sphingobium scionense]